MIGIFKVKTYYRKHLLLNSISRYLWDRIWSKRLITWDTLRLFQTANNIEASEEGQIATYISDVSLVEGVPVSGKTYEIIQKAKNGDVILTVALSTKDETAERVRALE